MRVGSVGGSAIRLGWCEVCLSELAVKQADGWHRVRIGGLEFCGLRAPMLKMDNF